MDAPKYWGGLRLIMKLGGLPVVAWSQGKSIVCEEVLNLTFHGTGAPHRSLDEGEASVWVELDTLRRVLDVAQSGGPIRVTFDDGNDSDIRIALPELLKRNMRAVFFIVAGRVGIPHFLNKEQLRELISAGMEIGSHGMNHRPWHRLRPTELREEIVDARDQIEQWIGRPVKEAACPFGSYGRRSLSELWRARYMHIHTSDGGWARSSDWVQPRNTIHRMDTVEAVTSLFYGGKKSQGLSQRLKIAVKRWR